MPGPLEVLRNVLNLEIRKDYNDTSVSGGLANFISFLTKSEITSSIAQANIDTLRAYFLTYNSLDHESRINAIGHLLAWLEDSGEELVKPSSWGEVYPKPQSDTRIQQEYPKQDPALYASVLSIRGIGERNISLFKKMGIEKIINLLRYFPRRYQDFSNLKTIDQVQYGDELSIIGSISQDVFVRDSKSGKLKIVETAISDGTGTIRLNWFNKPFLRNQLHKGMPVVVSGKVDTYLGRLVMTSPEWEPLESDQLHTNRIVPIYPLTAGISQRQLRNLIGRNLGIWVRRIKEYFNDIILKEEGLLHIQESLRQIHFPDGLEKLDQSRKRFAFEEIFFLQLGVLVQRRNWVELTARKFYLPQSESLKIDNSLPYELTGAQKRAIQEIFNDLNSGRP
ncbi:MAG: hypothetical protein FJZ98_06310, partial [Chloroflexi bacterium]|nr:hypothetical protein [Chloroflexota bacterium]